MISWGKIPFAPDIILLDMSHAKGGSDMAEKKTPKAEVILQYRQLECNMETVMQRIYEQYERKGNDLAGIEKLQVYVKPEDFAAYFVINDSYDGKVPLF